ncbi:MAG: U32 family peptidase [Candidatus Riflebacteria bacterium]|nr:U32 family peptidase [Candidatus Riflebacteria bacterium]
MTQPALERATHTGMNLSVATNFDDEMLRRISSYPVEEIYGKLPRDFVGGGRASYSTGDVGKSGLESHIRLAHSLGIRFNYLLNASCLGNREWSRHGYREIRRLLDYLVQVGVDSVTVSMPYLAEVIKKHYPRFLLKIGIFANIDSPIRARFWEDLGADSIVLESFSLNRSFALLGAIREKVSCKLQLIANFLCLPNCPMQVSHMNGISHGSNTEDTTPFIDYCIFKCSSMTLKDPSLLIKSRWIRPEDLSFYEARGFHSFKLLERNAPTDTLVKRVAAYAARTSPDNLMELIQPFGFKKEVRKEFGWYWSLLKERPGLVFSLYKLLKLRGMLFPLQNNPISLDSHKIPANFLDEISRRPCAAVNDCRDCGYCRSISDAAYRVDETYRDECLRWYKTVFRKLC